MQYRTSGGGFLSNIPPIVKNLIIINALMLVATMAFEPFMTTHFALFFPESPLFRPLQLFTHMFMHGGIWHLFFNMYAVWIFGSVLEQYWGPKRFLTYYLITGLGAAAFYLLVQWLHLISIEASIDPSRLNEMKELVSNGLIYGNPTVAEKSWFAIMAVPMLGASGAVFGVLLAFGMLFPNVKLQLLFPPVTLKAKWLVIIYGGLELALGMAQLQGDNIAHFAHLGGMLFGVILILYWRKKDGNRPLNY